jgi:hypothetical protein
MYPTLTAIPSSLSFHTRHLEAAWRRYLPQFLEI